MKIIEVNVPENEQNGLSRIEMIKLENVVCIAGQNGSGKSRLLKSIKDELLKKPKKSDLQQYESDLLLLERRKDETNKNILIYKEQIEEYIKAGDDLNKTQIAQNKNNISIWEKDNITTEEKIKSILESQSYIKLKTDDTYENYNFINFIPSSDVLIDHNTISNYEQKNFTRELENDNLLNFEAFNKKVFSLINQIQDRYIKSTHKETQHTKDEISKNISQYRNLQKYIKEFLGTILDFNNSPLLFDLPLEKAELSVGQSILLQFCVALSLQEGKLEDLIIFMDEPENHLHPKALLDVINKILKAIPNGQLWIATHSVHLLSHFEPERIWFMDEGKISHYGKSSLKVLESLVGDDERIEKMLNFMSLPGYIATNKFALECLSDPLSIMTGKDDKQVGLIHKALKTVQIPTILDFGAGQGRLLSILNELLHDENKDISELVNYYASDIKPNDNCANIIQKIYGDTSRYIVDVSNDKFSTSEYEKRFDIVLMCNVLHEIEPSYWIKIFADIHNILKDDGLLLIVEDHLIPYGEKAYDNGFIVFDIEQFKILFKITDEYEYKFNVPDYNSITSDEKNDARLKAHFIEKRFLNIQSEDINASLISQKEKAKNEILKLRKKYNDTGVKPDFKDGQKHGFWTQQFINCELVLEKGKF